MKKKILLLYSITLTVGVALIIGINHYTTAAYPTPIPTKQPPAQQVSVEPDTSISETGASETTASTQTKAVKKKSCSCCADRMTRWEERLRKARERKQRADNIDVEKPVSKGNGKAK